MFFVALQLFRDGALVGTTLLPNLTLEMGENVLEATGNFEVCSLWLLTTGGIGTYL